MNDFGPREHLTASCQKVEIALQWAASSSTDGVSGLVLGIIRAAKRGPAVWARFISDRYRVDGNQLF
jgi:hypothetical protein